MNHSVVEFIAPKEYMARAPQPIVYTFIIDVSVHAIQSGLTGTITRTILESLDRILTKIKQLEFHSSVLTPTYIISVSTKD